MKFLILIGALALMLSGCASYTASRDILSVYTDKSPSPVTREQACDIARAEAKEREGFPDEPRIPNKGSTFIIVSANRINDGGWRAIARSSVSSNRPDGGGGAMFRDVPAAVVTIDADGKVVGYSRHMHDEIYEARKRAGSRHPAAP